MQQTQVISRLGMFTASPIWKLMKSGRGKDEMFGDTAMTYIYEKIAEIITGESAPQARGAALDWGNNYEKDASEWAKSYCNLDFTYHGAENFIFWEYCPFSGSSPDGAGIDTVIEFKCPYTSSNHAKWLLQVHETGDNKWLKENHFEYYCQIQWNMLCGKKNSGIICSYDPRTVEPQHRMAILYISRDNEFINNMIVRKDAAVGIIQQALKSLK